MAISDTEPQIDGGDSTRSVRQHRKKTPLTRVTVAIAASLAIVFVGVFRLELATHNSKGTYSPFTSSQRLTTSQASVIQGLPVPKQAQFVGSDQHFATYTVPARVGETKAWYLTHLRGGNSWRNWTWVGANTLCSGHEVGDALFWEWEKGGSTLRLVVDQSTVNPPFADIEIDVYHQTPICGTSGP